MEITPIARARNDFSEKFGIPRQAGLTSVETLIVFAPEYRNPDMLRGLEGFSHLWLIWSFSENEGRWSPTVRPPRLGGNKRMGVFATRSPFRPNNLALSSVENCGAVELGAEGVGLLVRGADIMNGTPIYDIKPYLKYTDCHSDALGGYTDALNGLELEVSLPPELLAAVPDEKREPLLSVLRNDPRPSYQSDPNREYGLTFGGLNVRFRVDGGKMTVTEIHSV